MKRYGTDLRKKVIAFLESGGIYREAARVFGIAMYSISRWKKLQKDTDDLKDEKPKVLFQEVRPSNSFSLC